MELALLVYATDVIDTFAFFSFFTFFLGLVFGLIAHWGNEIENSNNEEDYTKWRKRANLSLKVALVSMFLCIFLPGKSTIHLMLAAYAGQEVYQSETMQRVAPKAVQVIEKYLDEQIEGKDVQE